MQIKTIMKYHSTPIGVYVDYNKKDVGENVEKVESFIPCWWECKVQLLWKNNLVVIQKIKVTIDLAISLLGLYPREMETYVHKKLVHNVYSSIIH